MNRLIHIFNKQLFEFSQQTVDTFPEILDHDELRTLHATLLAAITLTPNLPIQIFYDQFVKKYNQHIEKRDEQFLINLHKNKRYHQMLLDLNQKASENNRKIIWDYIEGLRLLCIKYFQNHEEKRGVSFNQR